MSKYGWFAVSEGPSALANLHLHKGAPLKETNFEPKCGVLDQEDLMAQGIHVETFIPGGKPGTDALGSCTANATLVHLSNLLSEAEFLAYIKANVALGYGDVKAAEIAAITFYNLCSSQTGQKSQEWPPTDCGSSGVYCTEEATKLHLAAGDKTAAGAENIVSLMQNRDVIVGSPFMNSWEEPDSSGFIDGNGSQSAFESALRSGVAGGHETCHHSIEKLTLTATDKVDPFNTVIRARNSWSTSWGDDGDYLYHLSTFLMMGNHADYRQMQPA
jgi:hypothetical protein